MAGCLAVRPAGRRLRRRRHLLMAIVVCELLAPESFFIPGLPRPAAGPFSWPAGCRRRRHAITISLGAAAPHDKLNLFGSRRRPSGNWPVTLLHNHQNRPRSHRHRAKCIMLTNCIGLSRLAPDNLKPSQWPPELLASDNRQGQSVSLRGSVIFPHRPHQTLRCTLQFKPCLELDSRRHLTLGTPTFKNARHNGRGARIGVRGGGGVQADEADGL